MLRTWGSLVNKKKQSKCTSDRITVHEQNELVERNAANRNWLVTGFQHNLTKRCKNFEQSCGLSKWDEALQWGLTSKQSSWLHINLDLIFGNLSRFALTDFSLVAVDLFAASATVFFGRCAFTKEAAKTWNDNEETFTYSQTSTTTLRILRNVKLFCLARQYFWSRYKQCTQCTR